MHKMHMRYYTILHYTIVYILLYSFPKDIV